MFIHGHHRPWLGKHHSKETKSAMSRAHIGKVFSEIHKMNMSKSLKGRVFSEEHKRKLSESQKGMVRTKETRIKIGCAHKGILLSEAHKNNIAKGLLGHISTLKGTHLSEEHKRKLSEANKDRIFSAKHKYNIARQKRKQWKNAEFARMMGRAWQLKPNKPETSILTMLETLYPKEWKYTGDFSFMIGGKNPDFVNCNGQKKCIELFGDYWHKDENPNYRKRIFAEYGYDTLVIWEHELKQAERVKFRINRFCRKSIGGAS